MKQMQDWQSIWGESIRNEATIVLMGGEAK